MKHKDNFTVLLPDDASDPDALYKQWSMFSPQVWDGYVVDDFELPKGTDAFYSPKELSNNQSQKISCECGAHRTYGTDCNAEFHSDWCILRA